MQELIDKLNELVEDSTIEYSEYLTEGYYDDLHPLLQEIYGLACGELIQNNGSPNFKPMKILKENGFPVVQGEADSFGWLTGVIVTPKGKIVYG